MTDAAPIIVDGERVGWVLLLPPRDTLGSEEELYIARTNQALLLGSASALVAALAVGVFLARRITAPDSSLTVAAVRTADGALGAPLAARRGHRDGGGAADRLVHCGRSGR